MKMSRTPKKKLKATKRLPTTTISIREKFQMALKAVEASENRRLTSQPNVSVGMSTSNVVLPLSAMSVINNQNSTVDEAQFREFMSFHLDCMKRCQRDLEQWHKSYRKKQFEKQSLHSHVKAMEQQLQTLQSSHHRLKKDHGDLLDEIQQLDDSELRAKIIAKVPILQRLLDTEVETLPPQKPSPKVIPKKNVEPIKSPRFQEIVDDSEGSDGELEDLDAPIPFPFLPPQPVSNNKPSTSKIVNIPHVPAVSITNTLTKKKILPTTTKSPSTGKSTVISSSKTISSSSLKIDQKSKRQLELSNKENAPESPPSKRLTRSSSCEVKSNSEVVEVGTSQRQRSESTATKASTKDGDLEITSVILKHKQRKANAARELVKRAKKKEIKKCTCGRNKGSEKMSDVTFIGVKNKEKSDKADNDENSGPMTRCQSARLASTSSSRSSNENKDDDKSKGSTVTKNKDEVPGPSRLAISPEKGRKVRFSRIVGVKLVKKHHRHNKDCARYNTIKRKKEKADRKSKKELLKRIKATDEKETKGPALIDTVAVNERENCMTITTPYYYTETVGVIREKAEEEKIRLREESAEKLIEVPAWREVIYDPATWKSTRPEEDDIEEDISDAAYQKRHLKYEIEERRRKRWDSQRQREESYLEKLKRRQDEREKQKKRKMERKARKSGLGSTDRLLLVNIDDEPETFHPQLEDALFIRVAKDIPIGAFGYPVPATDHSPFELPWMPRLRSCVHPPKPSVSVSAPPVENISTTSRPLQQPIQQSQHQQKSSITTSSVPSTSKSSLTPTANTITLQRPEPAKKTCRTPSKDSLGKGSKDVVKVKKIEKPDKNEKPEKSDKEKEKSDVTKTPKKKIEQSPSKFSRQKR